MSQRKRHSRCDRRRDRVRPPEPRGFTLVELLVVMVIISILLGFILNAAMSSVKRAQERATQTLITKLEGGLNDRLDALLQSRPDPRTAHLALAAVYNSTYYGNANYPNNGVMPGFLRAQVIAWYDYIKSEMPDTFFVQNDPNYPINFAGTPYPLGSTNLQNYILPMGNSIAAPYGDNNTSNPAGTGVYGASYAAAAGLYKNVSAGGISYLPPGYDGVDNNQNGLIDDLPEGVPNATDQQTFLSALAATHKHNTARAEMLYALLVEGRGPLGSVFNRDEFTDKEVQDTDGDGLFEFVDAWGNPLQFFRWPLLYHSDIQRGQVIQTTSENSWTLLPPYQNPMLSGSQSTSLQMLQTREQDPLDLNQQLMAPMWWSGAANANDSSINVFAGYPASVSGASGAVQAFEYYFHRLSEPMSSASGIVYWNRDPNNFPFRRAFYSKFLIVSGGPDGQLGVFLYSDTDMQGFGQNASRPLIANENNALPFGMDFVDFTQSASIPGNPPTIAYSPSNDPTKPSSSDLLQAAQDDITNQNIQSSVAIGGSR
jgi:prepilin-type N-terminal cleavage/methylation domain-containing protein